MNGYIKLTQDIFDEQDDLKNIGPAEWRADWLQKVVFPPEKPPETRAASGAGYDDSADAAGGSDDDIPF